MGAGGGVGGTQGYGLGGPGVQGYGKDLRGSGGPGVRDDGARVTGGRACHEWIAGGRGTGFDGRCCPVT